MKKATIVLLIKWIVEVMTMLCSRAEIFPYQDRKDLAQATANLEKALKEEEIK